MGGLRTPAAGLVTVLVCAALLLCARSCVVRRRRRSRCEPRLRASPRLRRRRTGRGRRDLHPPRPSPPTSVSRPALSPRPRPSCGEAWADPQATRIDLAGDIYLRDCHLGDPIRESPYPMVVDGHGFTHPQTCFEKRLLRQDGTGYVRARAPRACSRGGVRRAGGRGHHPGRDHAGRLHDHPEPRRGARRRRLLDAPGDRHRLHGSAATWPTTTAVGCTPGAGASRSSTRC